MTTSPIRNRRLGAGIIGLIVSGIALLVLVVVVDVGEAGAVLARTDLRWVALTLLMVPAQIVLRSARWALLLPHRADGHRPGARRIVAPMLTGYFANLILPARLGEAVRAYLVARRERLEFSRVLGSILLERVMDLATLAALAVAAAVVVGAPDWVTRGTVVIAAIGLALVAVLAASGIARSARVVAHALGLRVARVRRLADLAVAFGEGAGGGGRTAVAAAIGLSTLTWAFVAGTYWLLGRSLDIPLDPAQAMLVAAIATLGTAIPSAPAYLGTFEIAAVAAATALGVGAEEALALAVLAHAIATVPFALAGGAAVALMSISLDEVVDEAVAASRWTGTAGEPEPSA